MAPAVYTPALWALLVLIAVCPRVSAQLPNFAVGPGAAAPGGELEDRLAALWCKYGYAPCNSTTAVAPSGGAVLAPPPEAAGSAAAAGLQAAMNSPAEIPNSLGASTGTALTTDTSSGREGAGPAAGDPPVQPTAGEAAAPGAEAAPTSLQGSPPSLASHTAAAAPNTKPEAAAPHSTSPHASRQPRWRSQDTVELLRMLSEGQDNFVQGDSNDGNTPGSGAAPPAVALPLPVADALSGKLAAAAALLSPAQAPAAAAAVEAVQQGSGLAHQPAQLQPVPQLTQGLRVAAAAGFQEAEAPGPAGVTAAAADEEAAAPNLASAAVAAATVAADVPPPGPAGVPAWTYATAAALAVVVLGVEAWAWRVLWQWRKRRQASAEREAAAFLEHEHMLCGELEAGAGQGKQLPGPAAGGRLWAAVEAGPLTAAGDRASGSEQDTTSPQPCAGQVPASLPVRGHCADSTGGAAAAVARPALSCSPTGAQPEQCPSARSSEVHQWSCTAAGPSSSFLNPCYAGHPEDEEGPSCLASRQPSNPASESSRSALGDSPHSRRASQARAVAPAGNSWGHASSCSGSGSSRYVDACGGSSSGGSSPIRAIHDEGEEDGGRFSKEGRALWRAESGAAPGFKLGTAVAEAEVLLGQEDAAPASLQQAELAPEQQPEQRQEQQCVPTEEGEGGEAAGAVELQASGTGSPPERPLLAARSVGPQDSQAIAQWEAQTETDGPGTWAADGDGVLGVGLRLAAPLGTGSGSGAGAEGPVVVWQHTYELGPEAGGGVGPAGGSSGGWGLAPVGWQQERPGGASAVPAFGSTADAAGSGEELSGGIVGLSSRQFEQEVALGQLLGVGAAGSVHQANWRGQQVAVKLLHPSQQAHPASLASFQREVQMLGRIGRHPHIAPVLAACLQPPHCCIVQELAEQGSLWSLIHEKGLRFDTGTLLQLAEDVASAMAHCHQLSPPLVHRDLKPHNVLVTAEGRARVCDFGIARPKHRTFLTNDQGVVGTAAYTAPEVFSAGNVDERADVFGFAVLLWECLTGQEPWAECSSPMQIIMAVGVERRRLPIPADCPAPLRKLIKECWRHSPALRPPFAEVLQRLREMRLGGAATQQLAGAAQQTGRAAPASPKQAVAAAASPRAKFTPALAGSGGAAPRWKI